MDSESLEHLLSRGKSVNTDEFIRGRYLQFENESDGTRLLREMKIPFLKLPVPSASWDHMLEEALVLENEFVPHRSSDSRGWKSLCLHGIEATKTLSSDRYGYATERDAPYRWTEISAQCPRTTQWLQQLLEEKYFLEYYRVRYMWLEPGGYIKFHRDREPGKNSLGPLNIALNMPIECHWLFKQWGKVPFHPGAAYCVDVSYDHSVINNSNEGRIHLIIHGKYGPAYYKGLVEGVRLAKSLDKLKLPSSSPQPEQKQTHVEYALWDYSAAPLPSKLREICTNLTLHQLKLASVRVTPILRDHSLTRLLARAHSTGAKWCAVVVPGTVIKTGFFQSIERLVNSASENVFMFAHLMDRHERGVGIHEQFFLLDLQKWDALGRPSLGFSQSDPKQLIASERSAENVHDDYTPLWIKPRTLPGLIELAPKVLGWNLVNSALSAGFECQNIPEQVRTRKSFLYPTQNSSAVEDYLTHILENKEALKPREALVSSDQAQLLDYLRIESQGFQRKMFLFNTESYGDVDRQANKTPLDGLVAVSSGFKDLYMLDRHGFNSNCVITYYDVCKPVLSLKEVMFQKWDGRDFPNFLRRILDQGDTALNEGIISLDMDRLDDIWQQELAVWGGPDNFTKAYRAAQSLKKKFVQINVLDEPDFFRRALEDSEGQSFAVWFSNVFNYTPGLANWGWNNSRLENQGLTFLSGMHQLATERRKKIVLYGEDVVYGSRSQAFSGLASDLFK